MMATVVPEVDRDRVSAKQKVVDTWADRRKTTPSTLKKETTLLKKKDKPPHQPPESLPVCRVLKHAWEQTTLEVSRRLNPKHGHHKHHHLNGYGNSNGSSVHSKFSARPSVFPSVLPILHASAVASQVETLQDDDDVIMSVLPAGYDWDKAIRLSSQSRQRAFLLLDLAAMVKSHVTWKRTLKHVQLQYTVQHNRDPKLLELWCRLGVALRTNSSHDVQAALPALAKIPTGTLVDHAGVTRKPNGYLRRFLNATSSKQTHCLAVDGPGEVHRITETFDTLAQRNDQDEHHNLQFILRLSDESRASWNSLFQETKKAAEESSANNSLGGISLELPSDESDLTSLEQAIEALCMPGDRVDITGLSASPTPTVSAWLSKLGKTYSVTVDASQLLVAHAGALCTRIIGVKEDDTTRHYYIDDGCYGSLYRDASTEDYTPLPLYSADPTNTIVNSTVWGPTCDGLDRVCRNIPLPKLQVDEWLVFPNMGCGGGMGTAFNGFDPPDTAYCVLGYFRHM